MSKTTQTILIEVQSQPNLYPGSAGRERARQELAQSLFLANIAKICVCPVESELCSLEQSGTVKSETFSAGIFVYCRKCLIFSPGFCER